MIRRRSSAAILAAAITLLGLVAGCGDPTVIRVIDGVPTQGRFISYEAYAYYARGTEAEAHGDLPLAITLYRGAAENDAKSVEVWTRLGAASCASPDALAFAGEAFTRAEELDPTYEPLARARARCAADTGHLAEALKHAAHAVALDPGQDEAVLLYASLLERTGRVADAERTLDALVIERPTSVQGWLARYELALRLHDAVTAERAARALRQRAPRLATRVAAEVPALAPLAEVDAALRAGDLDAARKAARRAHLPAPELAVRAAALGLPRLARDQAELVLGADPSSNSARIALAVAADLSGDTALLATALDAPKDTPTVAPSPLARLLFTDLLGRRAGRDAARAFAGADLVSPDTPSSDPLLEAARKRVRALLAPSSKGA
ncbi:tetratricopeptide repeat protein [Polyangium sorediatum]|uniref:Tetratricopeptide repeat protein n=1 Tax=Polyangium sorediatum TaxID=889274 RepID=A0ABT6P0R6_9BACT|nr:tetratricopeptide repeat protein [Polyangium sorediatum]MDI1434148.1 tetratricopeptide repeat protein [Polyangium sorediatum]